MNRLRRINSLGGLDAVASRLGITRSQLTSYVRGDLDAQARKQTPAGDKAARLLDSIVVGLAALENPPEASEPAEPQPAQSYEAEWHSRGRRMRSPWS